MHDLSFLPQHFLKREEVLDLWGTVVNTGLSGQVAELKEGPEDPSFHVKCHFNMCIVGDR